MFVSPRDRRLTSLLLFPALLALALPHESMQDCTFPAVPTPRVLHQPDGSAIELLFRGTGANHWYEERDGFPVVQTDAGYAFARRSPGGQLLSTGVLVGSIDPRRLGLARHVVPVPKSTGSLGPSASALARSPSATPMRESKGAQGRTTSLVGGSVKNLVLLLRFSNHGPSGQNRTLPSSSDVGTIMNAVGGDPVLAPTGSVRDVYLENSYGQLSIDSTVVGWLDMPQSETYYANGNSGLTTRTWDLITAGLAAADAVIDFNDYDLDGDGWVDAITFLHSGYGAEWGGSDSYGTDYSDRMWSHKWTIPTWTSAEGVQVGDYNISPALWDTSGSEPGHIAVVCHELAHFFGLPDLYDTDGTSGGIGYWCLLAGGAWGWDGSQQYPSHLCAWAKMKMGWLQPRRLLPGTYNAHAVQSNAEVFLIDSGYPSGEYLLIENRQPIGFDALIPQPGLAIWHVDEGKGSFTYNDPNTDEGYLGQAGWPANDRHYRVALLQADGSFDLEGGSWGDTGDLYRSPFKTALGNNTSPDSKAYQGGTIVATMNRVFGIGASSASMAFTYSNTAAPVILTQQRLGAEVGRLFLFQLTSAGGSAPFTWTEFRDAPSYSVTDLGPQTFVTGGTAMNFRDDEATWGINLPFLFPYYETSYSRIYLTPNGCVDLAPLENESYNFTGSFRCLPRIAGLWDDLVTNGGAAQDIYLDVSSGAMRIRWKGEPAGSGLLANFAITLHDDGRIRFDYGPGNTGLTPTVGISRGHEGDFLLAATHDGQTSLTNASSLEFTLSGSQLPPWLTLSTSGLLSGVPPALGNHEFRIRVRDGIGRYDERLFTLRVHNKISEKP